VEYINPRTGPPRVGSWWRAARCVPVSALAPGGMLLLIVLSNTGFHLWAASHGASG
jgi:hypothetical protein